ncbi:MAG TPA: LuxR C-terminal-related transcriptional regulator [Streptosporangiaceae bacterium]|nr:LuxR C-terminal-related transcriptional regulator [Streptosporangiaceae bacterium]
MSISHTTAARHVANIMAKLGFNSRTQIAAWIMNQAQEPGRAQGPTEPG